MAAPRGDLLSSDSATQSEVVLNWLCASTWIGKELEASPLDAPRGWTHPGVGFECQCGGLPNHDDWDHHKRPLWKDHCDVGRARSDALGELGGAHCQWPMSRSSPQLQVEYTLNREVVKEVECKLA